jgi:hypothetical protein
MVIHPVPAKPSVTNDPVQTHTQHKTQTHRGQDFVLSCVNVGWSEKHTIHIT